MALFGVRGLIAWLFIQSLIYYMTAKIRHASNYVNLHCSVKLKNISQTQQTNFFKTLILSITRFPFSSFLRLYFVLYHRMLMASCQWRNSVKVPSLIHQLYRHYHCMMDWCSTMSCYTAVINTTDDTTSQEHPLCHLDNKHNGGSDHSKTLHTLFAVKCVWVCAWPPWTQSY